MSYIKKSNNSLGIIIVIILILLVGVSLLASLGYIYFKNKPVDVNETDDNIIDIDIPPQNETPSPSTNETKNETDDSNGDGGNGGTSCTPDCSGKECGGDGCGGSCGSCNTEETCENGQCVNLSDCIFDSDCHHLGGVCGVGFCNLTIETCYINYNSTTDMCRQSFGECDAVEYCSGEVDCPGDLNKSDGTICSVGVCDNGVCVCGVICGDGNCETGENCPQDKIGCEDNICYEPACNNGCGESLVPVRGNDESCVLPNFCNNGECIRCIIDSDCPTDGCYVGEFRDYHCNSNNCYYNDITIDESTLNGNCEDKVDNDCDGKIDGYDGNCENGPKCGDGNCEAGENCPEDVGSCPDNVCYIPICNNGCGEVFVEQGKNDEGCISPHICDGQGTCFEPVELDIEVSVSALKYNYAIGEDIDITDPPEQKEFTYEKELSPEEVESPGDFVEGEVIVKLKDHSFSELSYSKISSDIENKISQLESEHSLIKKNPVFKELHLELKSRDLSPKEYNQEIEADYSYIASSNPENISSLLSVYLMKINDGKSVSEKVKELKNNPQIEYAQPNYIMHAYYTPNDPYFSSSGSWGQSYDDLWGIKLIEADDAWDTAEGDGAIVAVIDTGIGYNHEDLRDNMWENPGEIPNNGQDDDGNGFIDDFYGYDFINNDGDPLDDNGHGSHCAGTIAASGNNNLGVIGVAPKVKLMAVKGLDSGGSGTTDDLAEGIRYAVDNGARVLSNSWGSQSRMPEDPILEEAVEYAISKGVVVVFAAGNSKDDVAYYSPQNQETTITVAASTPYDGKCSFSNYGELIDVSAPGGGSDNDPAGRGNILSTMPEGVTLATSDRKVSNGYYRIAGTSMACPHVAGLAGLILSISPDLTYQEVRSIIRDYSDDIGDPGKDSYFGYGRINILWSVRAIMGNIEIELTSPDKGSYLKGTVNLIGTIYSEDYFEKYEIYYADEEDLDNLILIESSTTPVQDGLLATWDTTQTSDGKKRLILKIITKDGKSLQKSFEVNVDNINEPPSFDGNPNVRIAKIGDLLQFELVAYDPDDPFSNWGMLTYNVENLPNGATYNTNTHIFSWTPSAANKGTYVVSFSASDNQFTTQFELLLATLHVDKRKVTNDAFSQISPSVYEDKIVWKENGIYLYNITSEEKVKISSLSTGYLPKVHGNRIIWADGANIYHYDILTKEEDIKVSDAMGFSDIEELDLYGDYFVYRKSFPDEISAYNLVTDTKRLCSVSIFSGGSSVYDDFVSFHDWGTETGIYRYNLDNFQGGLILEADFGSPEPQEPDVYENNLVYLGTSFLSSDIRVMNLLDEEIEFVNTDTTDNTNPKIYGENIVWTDAYAGGLFEDPRGDIYVYDLNIQKKIKITESGMARDHDIYGNRIVYSDRAAGDSSQEIYIADLYYSPIIFYVEPSLVLEGDTFNIIGDHFGYVQENSWVVFESGEEPEIISWDNNKIVCRVPSSFPASGRLRVITEGGPSNWIDLGIGKVESYIRNNENFPVTGNLKMILQRESGDEWIDEQTVINQQVTVSATNRIKLDSYWNPQFVSALTHGSYRIYAEFEYKGITYSEKGPIEVSGDLPSLERKGLLSRIIEWFTSLFR